MEGGRAKRNRQQLKNVSLSQIPHDLAGGARRVYWLDYYIQRLPEEIYRKTLDEPDMEGRKEADKIIMRWWSDDAV
jgi:hypothetical protein